MVVVAFERMQHGCGVSLVDDQETVEEFAADRRDRDPRPRPARLGRKECGKPGRLGPVTLRRRCACGGVAEASVRTASHHAKRR